MRVPAEEIREDDDLAVARGGRVQHPEQERECGGKQRCGVERLRLPKIQRQGACRVAVQIGEPPAAARQPNAERIHFDGR
jgi:hypothetical protein